MKINFNNVRKSALRSYTDLVKVLNKSLCTDVDYTRVVVPVQDIQRYLDSLRESLIAIGCTYNENDPDFKDIIEDQEIICFNPEEENNDDQ